MLKATIESNTNFQVPTTMPTIWYKNRSWNVNDKIKQIGTKSFQCTICYQTKNSKRNVVGHIPMQCVHCDTEFENTEKL